MTRSRHSRSWGIPWLGLPLSGVLALTGAGHSLWMADSADGLAGDFEAESSEALTEPAREHPPRSPDRVAELRTGQTLGTVLSTLGLEPEQVRAASLVAARHVDLRQLRDGTPWRAYLDAEGRLERFELVFAERGELALDRERVGWRPEWRAFARRARTRAVSGELDGSLESSVVRAGGLPELAYAMAEVLQWDLDFTRDLRRGDEFRILFEELEIEGSAPRTDRVLALSYGRAQGRKIEAYHFGEGERAGYYDADGRPLQKMFLRSPMPYSRVTSGYTSRRFHPVLGVFRPHYGVDYGAPVGTPVRVTASGTVVSAGWDRGGGKTIKVRHANGYLTAYLHLSRFAGGIRSGAVVRQGDVIGFVGSTGLATGPHLDYRVQLNGRWINPQSLKSVPAEPISKLQRATFLAQRDALRASLETGKVLTASTAQIASRGGSASAGAGRGATAAGSPR